MKPFLLFSSLLLSIITNAQKVNLVKNAGFERDIVNWRGADATISPFDKKSGKNGALINQYVATDWKGIDQIILIPRNSYALEFSIWIKTESIAGGKEAYNAGVVIAEFTSDTDKKISSETIVQVKGTTDWTSYKKTIIIPDGAQKIRLMLALAQTSGSIYFDDVKIIPFSKEEYSEINSMVTNPQK